MVKRESQAGSSDEIDVRAVDGARLARVVERLAARRDAASGEYVGFYADRHDLAKVWKDDFDRGVALSPDRREGLLEFEATADPALGGAPYRLFVPGKDGRLQIASLRVLQGAGSFFLAQVGGAEGAPYARLSKEEWATQAEAAKALREGLWTPRSERIWVLRH